MKIKFHLDELYLKSKLSPGLVALFSHQLMQVVAGSLLGVFLPIFLFQKFSYSLKPVILFYLAGFLLYGLTVPIGAMIMSRLGLKKTMFYAVLALIGYYLAFYWLERDVILVITIIVILITIFRSLYWIPYHTKFAKFTDSRHRGKQISFLNTIAAILGIAAPVSAGFIIENFTFNALFGLAVILLVISLFPLLLIPRVEEKYSYGYIETFRELFRRKKNKRLLLAYGADGAEAIVGLVIWPVFIFNVLEGRYFAVGAISSAVVAGSIFLRLIIGGLTDKMRGDKKKLIKVGSVLYALGWFVKTFIQTGFQIFVTNTYHHFVGIIRGTPFSALMYEQAADRGHYVDEYTVLREISLNIGRVLMLGLLFVLINYISLNYTFLLAAVVSLFINVL